LCFYVFRSDANFLTLVPQHTRAQKDKLAKPFELHLRSGQTERDMNVCVEFLRNLVQAKVDGRLRRERKLMNMNRQNCTSLPLVPVSQEEEG
jgi:hypothetical protein